MHASPILLSMILHTQMKHKTSYQIIDTFPIYDVAKSNAGS
jgi:hypothetical protein